jgi:hypothetical protein
MDGVYVLWKFSNFLYLTIKKNADFKHIAQTYSNVIASLNECLLKSNKCKISKLEKRKNKIKQNSIGANSTSRTFVLHCMQSPFGRWIYIYIRIQWILVCVFDSHAQRASLCNDVYEFFVSGRLVLQVSSMYKKTPTKTNAKNLKKKNFFCDLIFWHK